MAAVLAAPPTAAELALQPAVVRVAKNRETDFRMVRFVTVLKSDRGGWKYVYRRLTYDRDTGELLSDESVEGLTNAQLYRELDQPRRLRVEFHLRDVPVSKDGEMSDTAVDLFHSVFSNDETDLEQMVKSRRPDGERDA